MPPVPAAYTRFAQWLTPERAHLIEGVTTWGLAPFIVAPLVAWSSKPGEKISNVARDFSRYMVGAFDYFVVGTVAQHLFGKLGIKQPAMRKLLGFLTAFAVNEAYYGYFSIKLAQQCTKKNPVLKYFNHAPKNTELSSPAATVLPQDGLKSSAEKYQSVYRHFNFGLTV